LALLVLPLYLLFRSRDFSGIILTLPALYSHSVYAAISHFIPRYAIPEIPLRAAALCAMLYFVWIASTRAWDGRWRSQTARALYSLAQRIEPRGNRQS
jgi:hypothetical protein